MSIIGRVIIGITITIITATHRRASFIRVFIYFFILTRTGTFSIFGIITVSTVISTRLVTSVIIITIFSIRVIRFTFTRLTVRISHTFFFTRIVIISFGLVLFHPLVKFFSKIKNIIGSFGSSSAINPNFFLFRKRDCCISRFEKYVNPINQIKISNIFLSCTKEIFFKKINITSIENTNGARILTFNHFFNSSILKDVHKTMIDFPSSCTL